jgi:hypothetical protein
MADRIPTSCIQCRYFDEALGERYSGYGHCRRGPPLPAMKGRVRSGSPTSEKEVPGLHGGWLVVKTTDWCGAGSTGIDGLERAGQ